MVVSLIQNLNLWPESFRFYECSVFFLLDTKVVFETVFCVEREGILWEGEKRLQGHLLCSGLERAEIRHRTLVGHPQKEGGYGNWEIRLWLWPLSFPGTLSSIIFHT